jgi:hypothetical protein
MGSASELSSRAGTFGLNLLAGVGFWPRQTVRPYVQGKVILSNNTEAVLGFGVRFP